MDIEKIVAEARQQEKWSVNKKYNYGPIEYLKQQICFNNLDDSRTIEHRLNLFNVTLGRVTDAKTYFIYCFRAFDVYVCVSDLVHQMKCAFPEVSRETVYKWIIEEKESHHLLVA